MKLYDSSFRTRLLQQLIVILVMMSQAEKTVARFLNSIV